LIIYIFAIPGRLFPLIELNGTAFLVDIDFFLGSTDGMKVVPSERHGAGSAHGVGGGSGCRRRARHLQPAHRRMEISKELAHEQRTRRLLRQCQCTLRSVATLLHIRQLSFWTERATTPAIP
jgi:hypothetical protein